MIDPIKSLAQSRKITRRCISRLNRDYIQMCYSGKAGITRRRYPNPVFDAWANNCKERGEQVAWTDYFDTGQVYLASESSGLYKIGVTANATRRVKHLTFLGLPCTSPILLDAIVCCCTGHAEIIESLLHSYLDSNRLIGEWFCLDDEEAINLCLLIIQIKSIRRLHGLTKRKQWFESLQPFSSRVTDLNWLSQVCALLNRPFQFTNPEPDPRNPFPDSDGSCDGAKQSAETAVSKRDNLLHWGVKVPRRPLACSHDVQGKKVCCLGN